MEQKGRNCCENESDESLLVGERFLDNDVYLGNSFEVTRTVKKASGKVNVVIVTRSVMVLTLCSHGNQKWR